jgi:diamine N-acetyltransferase
MADASAVSVFARRVFEETFGPDNDPRDIAMYTERAFTTARQANELADPLRVYLIGEDDGALASYALLHVGASHVAVRGPRPMEIERFYVDSRWHGQGVAHAMMDAALEVAHAEHAETIWLGVWCENARAIRFYEKRGFRDVGSHTFLLGTDLQTDRVMARSLSATSSDS